MSRRDWRIVMIRRDLTRTGPNGALHVTAGHEAIQTNGAAVFRPRRASFGVRLRSFIDVNHGDGW